jgi:hypothetical protein
MNMDYTYIFAVGVDVNFISQLNCNLPLPNYGQSNKHYLSIFVLHLISLDYQLTPPQVVNGHASPLDIVVTWLRWERQEYIERASSA